MELDFEKICRVCLNEGVMMSIFKVNVSKKLMACASVQVWQSDRLPAQICNKCAAKLHISFQFKKQCEKSDAKLRQIILSQSQEETVEEDPPDISTETEIVATLDTLPQQITQNSQNNCVYIDCAAVLDVAAHEQKFDAFITNQNQPPLAQINYNIPPQNHMQLNYNMHNPMQVYNGSYTTLHTLQQNNINQLLPHPPLQMQPPQQIQQMPQILPPPHLTPVEEPLENKKDMKKPNSKIKSPVNNKQCNVCNKLFESATKLSRHMKSHSTDLPYKCATCSKAFSHSGNYKIHLRMHTDERPYKCNFCGKGCRQQQDLEKHLRIHTGERPHKCTVCPRAFSTSSNLIAHIRTHTGERPYVCSVCGKAFCQSNELTKHMRTHTGEKSHVCNICNKGFNGSSTLIVHKRSHTGERPYICKICNKSFTQSSCLSVHVKRHNGEKKYICALCEKGFVTKADLKDHEGIHKKDMDLCGLKFGRVRELDNHMEKSEES